MPGRPASETGRKKMRARRDKPTRPRVWRIFAVARPGAEGMACRVLRLSAPWPTSSMAKHTCAPLTLSAAPDKSTTLAPDARAAGRLRFANAAGHSVGTGKNHENKFRVFPDDGDQKTQQHNRQGRLASRPGNIFEAVVTNGAGHQRAERGGEPKPGQGPALVLQRRLESVHERGDYAGRGRGGHGHKTFRTARSPSPPRKARH